MCFLKKENVEKIERDAGKIEWKGRLKCLYMHRFSSDAKIKESSEWANVEEIKRKRQCELIIMIF